MYVKRTKAGFFVDERTTATMRLYWPENFGNEKSP
jgi:hypothetical protein